MERKNVEYIMSQCEQRLDCINEDINAFSRFIASQGQELNELIKEKDVLLEVIKELKLRL